MNSRLKELLDGIADWPQEAQERAISVLEMIEHSLDEYVLSPEDIAAIERRAEDVRQGRFATDEQVRQLFDRYRQQG